MVRYNASVRCRGQDETVNRIDMLLSSDLCQSIAIGYNNSQQIFSLFLKS